MLFTRPSRFPLALALGAGLGCGAGLSEPAGGFFPSLPASDDDCVPAVTPIAHLDEPSALGFSAVDALNQLGGSSSSPLFWLEPPQSQEYLLSLGPEAGPSSLELELRGAEGPILHRYRTPRLFAPEGTACDPGALQIPVSVTLESERQGLAESFEAVLEARAPYRGHLSKSFEPGALHGSLGLAHVASLDPQRSFGLGPVQLEADVWPGGSAGSLAIRINARHAKESKALRAPPPEAEQPGPLAVWPSPAVCEGAAVAMPPSARVLGFSVDDVLAELRGPRRLSWSDGSVTRVGLALEAEGAELCQEVGERLSFRVMLHAQSEDGLLDVRLPVRVEALDAGGRIGDISIESAEPDKPFPIARGADGAGSNFDAQGYRALLVGVEWSHSAHRDTGSLSLRGVDAAQPDGRGIDSSTALTSGRW